MRSSFPNKNDETAKSEICVQSNIIYFEAVSNLGRGGGQLGGGTAAAAAADLNDLDIVQAVGITEQDILLPVLAAAATK